MGGYGSVVACEYGTVGDGVLTSAYVRVSSGTSFCGNVLDRGRKVTAAKGRHMAPSSCKDLERAEAPRI